MSIPECTNRWPAGILCGALLVTLFSLPAPLTLAQATPRSQVSRQTAASARPLIVTGTVFPAGFGWGVASDPLGLLQALWAPLVGFDAHLRPYAVLATRVPSLQNGDVKVIGGGMRVTVHLRTGLRFSDGSPLTARDVLFGERLNRDEAIGNSFGLDEITRIEAPDAHTVVLTFGDLYGAYLAYAMPPALPQAYLERKYHSTNIHTLALAYVRDAYSSPHDVFSGPYRLSEVAAGQRITLTPNRYFAAPANRNRPELRYVILSNDETALTRDLATASGTDLALGLGLSNLPALLKLHTQGWQTQVLPSLAVEHLELNSAVKALQDLRVRQALQEAIDKAALARALFPTSIKPARFVATSLIASASPYHDPTIKVSRYSPSGARSLLRAAGYATTLNGPGRHLHLELVTTSDPTRQREADLLLRAWAVVGIQVTVRLVSGSPLDRGGLYAPFSRNGVLATRQFQIALFDLRLGPDPATVASYFDPDRIPTPLSQGAWRRNYTGIDNEALAALPETAQAALDALSRYQGYRRLEAKVNALLPYIVLFEEPALIVSNGHLRTLSPGPQDEGVFWNVAQWSRR